MNRTEQAVKILRELDVLSSLVPFGESLRAWSYHSVVPEIIQSVETGDFAPVQRVFLTYLAELDDYHSARVVNHTRAFAYRGQRDIVVRMLRELFPDDLKGF